jgi:hypothetical protein
MARGEGQANEPDSQDGEQQRQSASIIPVERIQSWILLIRGQKVILDSDLARLYGVPTKRLNEQVKRNPDRFPLDFVFRLNREEFDGLISHLATSNVERVEKGEVVANCDHLQRLKFSSVLPYAFTEHGAIMAASVLNSPQAVRTSIFVVRAFVRLRQVLASNETLARRLERLEEAVGTHDRQIVAIVDALHLLMPPEGEPPREPFGFRPSKKADASPEKPAPGKDTARVQFPEGRHKLDRDL